MPMANNNNNVTKTMTKTKTALLSMLLLLTGTDIMAQSGQYDDEEEENTYTEETYDEMLSSTAQIMFVDSMVTDSAGFIYRIPLGHESGTVMTSDDFRKTSGNPSAYAHVNGLGNKVIFSKKDSNGHFALYTADRLRGKWTDARRIADFDGMFEDINCPYMMADGTTLYFAARGGERGLGGYDIYVTRYDIGADRFYTPENIGLPYNSQDDDYYCITDDYNHLGWLVTNRRQPAGSVCIYTMVPPQGRSVYDENIVGEELLRNLADLTSISDTWTDSKELDNARRRLAGLTARNPGTNKERMSFIVNDNTVYTSMTDFKSHTNRVRYEKLKNMKKTVEDMSQKLENMRKAYTEANSAGKKRLAPAIYETEHKVGQLEEYIHALEKEIRNTENMLGE